MIDVAREELLTREEAASRCKVSVFTIDRWIRQGCKRTGRKLEKVLVGGSVRTSVQALARFSVHPVEAVGAGPELSDSARQAQDFFRRLEQRKTRR